MEVTSDVDVQVREEDEVAEEAVLLRMDGKEEEEKVADVDRQG